jgi:ATP-dependent DNA ligase
VGVFSEALASIAAMRASSETGSRQDRSVRWRVHDVNAWLDALSEARSAPTAAEGTARRLALFRRMVSECSPLEQKYLVKEVLLEMRIGIGEATILTWYHPDAVSAYESSISLKSVCADPGLRHPEARKRYKIEVTKPFAPMHAKRLMVDFLNSQQFGRRFTDFFVEKKYDGERIVIHKKGDTIMCFSRRSHSRTELAACLKPYLCAAIHAEEVILDCELLAYDPEVGCYMNYYGNRSLVKETRNAAGGDGGSLHPRAVPSTTGDSMENEYPFADAEEAQSKVDGSGFGPSPFSDGDAEDEADLTPRSRLSIDEALDEAGIEQAGNTASARSVSQTGYTQFGYGTTPEERALLHPRSAKDKHISLQIFDLLWLRGIRGPSSQDGSRFRTRYRSAAMLGSDGGSSTEENEGGGGHKNYPVGGSPFQPGAIEKPNFTASDAAHMMQTSLGDMGLGNITALPLWKRKELLEKIIFPQGRHVQLAHGERVFAGSAKIRREILLKRFLEVVQGSTVDEGIMVKDAQSEYEFGIRSDKWLKLKGEYSRGISDVDCVIIGGYFGTGRSSGRISRFLVAVGEAEPGMASTTEIPAVPQFSTQPRLSISATARSDTIPASTAQEISRPLTLRALPRRFKALCKIGTGYGLVELRNVLGMLGANWRRLDKQSPLPPWFGGSWKLPADDRPDMVIHPRSSVLVTVKGAELHASPKWPAGYSVRFPRLSRFRLDKPVEELTLDSELEGLYREGKGRIIESSANVFGYIQSLKEDRKGQTTRAAGGSPKTPTIGRRMPLHGLSGGSLLPAYHFADQPEVIPVSNVLEGLRVCVLPGDYVRSTSSDSHTASREDLIRKVRLMGGMPTHYPMLEGEETEFSGPRRKPLPTAYDHVVPGAPDDIYIGDITTTRTHALTRQGKNVFSAAWLDHVFNTEKIPDELEPEWVVDATDDLRQRLALKRDKFGDYNERASTLESLRDVIAAIPFGTDSGDNAQHAVSAMPTSLLRQRLNNGTSGGFLAAPTFIFTHLSLPQSADILCAFEPHSEPAWPYTPGSAKVLQEGRLSLTPRSRSVSSFSMDARLMENADSKCSIEYGEGFYVFSAYIACVAFSTFGEDGNAIFKKHMATIALEFQAHGGILLESVDELIDAAGKDSAYPDRIPIILTCKHMPSVTKDVQFPVSSVRNVTCDWIRASIDASQVVDGD